LLIINFLLVVALIRDRILVFKGVVRVFRLMLLLFATLKLNASKVRFRQRYSDGSLDNFSGGSSPLGPVLV
jgi:hypothetical protein